MPHKPSPPIEYIRNDFPRSGYRAAIFDFDGTLSLIRRNWQGIMIPLMVEVLVQLDTGETPTKLRKLVEGFVVELTGRPTLVQMQRLTDEIKQRGFQPEPATHYLNRYQECLMTQANARIRAVLRGHASPDTMAVAGSRRMLTELQQRNVHLVLASGTELKDVKNELEVLEFTPYFEQRVHGPVNQDPKFSKQVVMEQLVGQGLPAQSLIAIGDGPAEIEAIKRVGGVAIGLASNEISGAGVDPLKREHLVRAGADVIIGDYHCYPQLLERLGLHDVPVRAN